MLPLAISERTRDIEPPKTFLFENFETLLNLLQTVADGGFGDSFCGGNICVAHAAELLQHKFSLLGKQRIP